ncbi:MAG TPA: ATP-binding protein [Thermoleophilaceae bacterium]|nr:ATP-binding protein [Thermoleophilaceae bacterium]
MTFADQAKGQLETINWRLRAFETAASDQRRALLDEIFRELHNLKGAARSVDLVRVEAMVHDLEDVLSAVREEELEAHASVAALAGSALDGLAALIGEATAAVQAPRNGTPTRLAPVSTLFEAFPRTVGELARALAKEVVLTVACDDFDVDKRVLDQLRSPLMHMVRNSVDHGVEDPLTRAAAGKKRQGEIVLAARRRATALVVEVTDDGAGIDVATVKAAAVGKGFASAGAVERMSEEDALWLIFRPGLSSRQEATRLSGRGVGLDVVREHIERLHGAIDVKSAPGKGTTFTLTVPLGASTC